MCTKPLMSILAGVLCGCCVPACVSEVSKQEAREHLLALPGNAPFRECLQTAHVSYALPNDSKPQSAEWHEIEASYVRLGPRGKPIVLLLHGTPSSLFTWRAVLFGSGEAQGLATDFDTIAVDLPGHGLSDASPPNSWDAMVAFVISFLQTMNVDCPIAIIGNSYGGEIAWRLARTHPEMVDRLVLISSSGYRRQDGEVSFFDSLLTGPLGGTAIQFSTRGFVRDGLREVFADPLLVTDDLVEEKYYVLHAQGNRQTAIDMYRAERDSTEVPTSRIRARTLLLWGSEDHKYTVKTQADQFARDLPATQRVVLESCGHTPQYECPEKVIANIRQFLCEP